MPSKYASVDDYIDAAPTDVQGALRDVRARIRDALPAAGEKISYNMPTVTIGGEALLYFAAWKSHIGIYPVPRGDSELEDELAPLRAAKDTVRFPLDQPMPLDLISRIVAFMASRLGDTGEIPRPTS